MTETVLLVESDHGAVRAITVTQPGVYEIIERLHLNPQRPQDVTIRLWRNQGRERDLTGRLRIFREVLDPPAEEPSENPIHQEMELDEPIPFTADETPNGFRRKHLRDS